MIVEAHKPSDYNNNALRNLLLIFFSNETVVKVFLKMVLGGIKRKNS